MKIEIISSGSSRKDGNYVELKIYKLLSRELDRLLSAVLGHWYVRVNGDKLDCASAYEPLPLSEDSEMVPF